MVSSIGNQLSRGNLITGFGMHRMPLMRHHVVGHGIGRRIAGHLTKSIGHALVNKISSMIAGEGHKRRRAPHRRVTAGSYRVTGTGRRTTRKPRATLSRGCGVRRTYKPRTRTTVRKPRMTLLLGGRKRKPMSRRRHFVLI